MSKQIAKKKLHWTQTPEGRERIRQRMLKFHSQQTAREAVQREEPKPAAEMKDFSLLEVLSKLEVKCVMLQSKLDHTTALKNQLWGLLEELKKENSGA